MWLWIFGILIVLAVWAVWFLFPPVEPGGPEIFPTWIPITVTVVIIGGLILLFVIRRIRAARAARALEKAIAQQAQEHALAAKPEDKEHIQALYKQFSEGIAALKRSKLGAGKGENALYALPWYAIVGPPGAGKTTALRHSGLQFPFLDPSGGGVRGVGGTRNCDWWFTNEAILIDTAGRYTVEEDDRDEWIAFLEQLVKYREEKPLNGIVVAVSVNELLDATEDGIKQTASRVRARIDEMQTTLKMQLPVYVFFTKTDLIAGFTEFFGDLKKSERGQPWGATFRLEESKAEPGRLFDREFDILVERVYERITKRINTERSRPGRERIYQFPLEFAAIKRNLSDFMAATFPPAEIGPQPLLRGFYFTSGTQEGKPLDRVVGAMGRAFGLKGGAPEEEAPKEPKSYFLRDVFMSIIFEDQKLAALNDVEVRRRLVQKLIIAAAAAVVSLILLVPAAFSFVNNRDLVNDTERISTAAKGVNWGDADSMGNVQKLDELRLHLMKLKDWQDNGKPISYSWGMYQGNELYGPLRAQYIDTLNKGFLSPSKGRLEDKLKVATGEPYLPDYNNLKTYLLLNDTERLKEPELEKFQVARLTQTWADVLLPTSGVAEADLKPKLYPHVEFYVRLQRDKEIAPVNVDAGVVESTRTKLRTADPVKAYYELFVISLIDEKIDETAPDTPENRKYPALTLPIIFEDRPEVLGMIGSKKYRDTKAYLDIRGPFTAEGFKQVDKSLKDGAALLEREAWVVPYSAEEKAIQENIKKSLRRVRQRYEDEYISEWSSFFRDLDVKIPITNREAIDEFQVLSTPDWPYRRLLETLSENTQFVSPNEGKLPSQLAGDGGVISQVRDRVRRRLEAQTGIREEELKSMREITSQERIKARFEPMVKFGIAQPYVAPPPDPSGAPAPPPKAPEEPELAKYVKHLETLAGEMQVIEEGPLNQTDTGDATKLFEKAVKESEGMLLKMDKLGQELMEPLLMNPLRQAYRTVLKGAGGRATGLWEVMVWPHYRDKIKDRYPFNVAARRDASYEDTVAFFKPKEGVIWGFYDAYLKSFHMQQEHKFIPLTHLQGKGAKGKPYTPFNPLMYNCLERAHEITDALWSGGAADPKITFQINLKTVSPIVSDVIFEVDGQKRVYRNEKEFFYEFAWPGGDKRYAKIQVRGAGGLDEEIMREGPWGILRLFESADQMSAVKDNDEQFLVTWQMTAPPVSVTMQVRPRRGNHPFPISFFRGMNCPPSIGDKFGGDGS